MIDIEHRAAPPDRRSLEYMRIELPGCGTPSVGDSSSLDGPTIRLQMIDIGRTVKLRVDRQSTLRELRSEERLAVGRGSTPLLSP